MSLTTVTQQQWEDAADWLRNLSVHQADLSVGYMVVETVVTAHREAQQAAPLLPGHPIHGTD